MQTKKKRKEQVDDLYIHMLVTNDDCRYGLV
jgi:hypothetical protein